MTQPATSAPPSYRELSRTVEDYLTAASTFDGWSIDALEEATPGKLQVFPFARSGAVGAHVVYSDASSRVRVQSEYSSALRSWTDLLPVVRYVKAAGRSTHTVDYCLKDHHLAYAFSHPVFSIDARSAMMDGFRGLYTATTRIFEKVFVGACANYDPRRSGLRNLSLIAVRHQCPNVSGGDLLAKYTLEDGFSLHVRVPVHTYLDVAVISERRRFIAGIQGRSPCGARIMLATNVNDGTVTATAIRNLNDIWKLSVTYTSASLGNSGSGSKNTARFGLKLSNSSIDDENLANGLYPRAA